MPWDLLFGIASLTLFWDVFNYYDNHDLERLFNGDLDRLNSIVGERNSRWLVSSHKKNAGESASRMAVFRKGTDKAINSLSNDSDILNITGSDEGNTVYRIDLDAYGLDASDWALIVAVRVLN